MQNLPFFVWNRAFDMFAFKCLSEHYKIRIVWTTRPRIASTCCLLAIFFLPSQWNQEGVNGAEPASSGSWVQLSLASVSLMQIIVSLLVTAFSTSTDFVSSSPLSFSRDLSRVRVVFYHLLFLSFYLPYALMCFRA